MLRSLLPSRFARGVAVLVLATACSSPGDRGPSITAPSAALGDLTTPIAATLTFSCQQNFASRPYAFYAVKGDLVAGKPLATVVYRPHIGDTLSRKNVPVLVSGTKYPGWPQYNVWNVRGGPAGVNNDLYYLLLPKTLPGAGGMFPAELHVLYDGGNAGWAQSTQDCTVSGSGVGPPPTAPFSCVQNFAAPPYAFYAVRGDFVVGVPTATVVFRPNVGDTLSRKKTAVLVSPAKYPGWPQWDVWNVRGGPAGATNDLFYLLLPKALPGPGGQFPAELHILFDGGSAGGVQSTQDCTVN